MTEPEVLTPSQALIVRPAVLPSTAQFSIMRDLALRLASARGFLPDHYFTGNGEERFAKVLAAIEYGRAVGIEPMIALQNITMIDGKAGASALLIGAQLRRAGYKLKEVWFDSTGVEVPKRAPLGQSPGQLWGCEVSLSKNGEKTGDGSFSMTDAQRAGLIKERSGWMRYPKDMLYARALTQSAREGAQDAVLGMQYTAEELGADVDDDGRAVTLPPSNGSVIDGEVVPAVAPGVSEATAGTNLPTAAAIQPTPPAPSAGTTMAAGVPAAEVSQEPVAPAAEVPQAPPQTAPFAPTPLAGPSVSRRMGRSIGPQPKRTNTVEVPHPATGPIAAEQAAEKAALAAEMARQSPVPDGPGEPALAPSDLIEEPAPVDEGKRVYLDQQRELLREGAAELAHVNALLKNQKNALTNEPVVPVPPKTPTTESDQGLARLIERDYPGRTLSNLGEPELQNRLELVSQVLADRLRIMAERGITEE